MQQLPFDHLQIITKEYDPYKQLLQKIYEK